jgi:two-component system, sensor histidine kinase and response regulator
MITLMDEGAPRPRILVAEDNAVNLRVALRMLAKLGYDADAAENGREAVTAVARARYDLVLMDCQMPELDGYAATGQIRDVEAAGPDARRLPIVAMTANALPGDRERCLAAGMDDYLSKPVTLDALAEVLRRWVPRTSAEAAEPPGAGAPAVPVADQTVLAQLGDPAAGGDPEFLREVADIFLSETPGRLQGMREAAERGDAEALARIAHTLKSGCGSLGLRRMQARCGEIEAHGRAGRADAATPLVAGLAEELQLAEAALRDAIARAR